MIGDGAGQVMNLSSEKKLMAKITIIENIKNDKKALTFIAATRGARGFNSSKARKKLMI